MLLALLSDTHDNVPATRAALELLGPFHPAAYLHAGDMVSPEMLPLFAGLPLHFVFGNNEYDHAALRSMAAALELHCHERLAELTFGGKSVALLHGHDQTLFHRLVCSRPPARVYHYIICGHSHQRCDERVGNAAGTRVINPGALYRTRSKSVALLDLAADTVKFLEVPVTA